MPFKRVHLNTKDAPWMTTELKSTIIKRQAAFHDLGPNSIQYKFYRNTVNPKRKLWKSKFYESKIQHFKDKDPKRWWNEVKQLSGSLLRSGDLRNCINVPELNDLPPEDLANSLNTALLEPLEEYRLDDSLVPLPLEDASEFLEVPEHQVYKLLCKLDSTKPCGPDGIPNWLLKEYAVSLVYPITKVLTSMWKLSDVTPIPKRKPVKDVNKDLRPISLTPCLSKLAEDLVLTNYVKPEF